jgi:hypothetical protein
MSGPGPTDTAMSCQSSRSPIRISNAAIATSKAAGATAGLAAERESSVPRW